MLQGVYDYGRLGSRDLGQMSSRRGVAEGLGARGELRVFEVGRAAECSDGAGAEAFGLRRAPKAAGGGAEPQR